MNGRSIVRLRVVTAWPPTDNRRCGDVTYSGSSLECGRQIWGTGRHLLLATEDGTVRENLAQERAEQAHIHNC